VADVVFSTQSYRKLQLKTRKKKENKKTNKTQKKPNLLFSVFSSISISSCLEFCPHFCCSSKSRWIRSPVQKSPVQIPNSEKWVGLPSLCFAVVYLSVFGRLAAIQSHLHFRLELCSFIGLQIFPWLCVTHFVVTSKTAARAVDADIYSPSMWQTTEDAYS